MSLIHKTFEAGPTKRWASIFTSYTVTRNIVGVADNLLYRPTKRI